MTGAVSERVDASERPHFSERLEVSERLDELVDWLDSPASELAGNVAQLLELARRSAREATLKRSEMLVRALGHGVDSGPAGVDRNGPAPTLGIATSIGAGKRPDESIRAWALLPHGHTTPVLLAHLGDGEPRLAWLDATLLDRLPRLQLIGLEGLELLDLTQVADAARELDGRRVLAATALGDVLDAAIDLGITLGFLARVGAYLVRSGSAATEREQSLLERLGAAYAELGVVSEALHETVAAAPGASLSPATPTVLATPPATPSPASDLRAWAERAARDRAFASRVHGRLLSDLFEAAGASATSRRLALDRSWRDFVTRQAVFPIGPAVDTENAITRRWPWRLGRCTSR
jgi:hypothetical protein